MKAGQEPAFNTDLTGGLDYLYGKKKPWVQWMLIIAGDFKYVNWELKWIRDVNTRVVLRSKTTFKQLYQMLIHNSISWPICQ